MPVMTDKVLYTNLAIKPPITLRMEIPKSAIDRAKTYFGQTVGGTTVDNVRYGLEIHVCREGEPDCTTTQFALSVVFSSDRGNNRWLVTVYVESYYVSPTAQFVYEAFKFGQERDVVIDVTFRDSYLSVVFNNVRILDTDLLKKFEQIRTLKANNYFYDPTGAEVNVGTEALVYNLKIMQVADLSGVVGTVVPVAVAVAVISALATVLVKVVK